MNYRPNSTRGRVDCSRLGQDNYLSQRSFDFEEYQSGVYLNWGPVMTINDDRTREGFVTAYHEHRNLDILSYVVEGRVQHHDNLGNDVIAGAGQIQHMSCGTGIWHTEANPDSQPNRYLQIWIASNQLTMGWTPSYQLITRSPGFELLPLQLQNTRIEIRAGVLEGQHSVDAWSYLLVLEGSCRVDEFELSEGDSLEFTRAAVIEGQGAHCLLFTHR
jgi:redox-sensitive bicupin YhaK (pirin superfamily)